MVFAASIVTLVAFVVLALSGFDATTSFVREASTALLVAVVASAGVSLVMPLALERRLRSSFRRLDPAAKPLRARMLVGWNVCIVVALLVLTRDRVRSGFDALAGWSRVLMSPSGVVSTPPSSLPTPNPTRTTTLAARAGSGPTPREARTYGHVESQNNVSSLVEVLHDGGTLEQALFDAAIGARFPQRYTARNLDGTVRWQHDFGTDYHDPHLSRGAPGTVFFTREDTSTLREHGKHSVLAQDARTGVALFEIACQEADIESFTLDELGNAYFLCGDSMRSVDQHGKLRWARRLDALKGPRAPGASSAEGVPDTRRATITSASHGLVVVHMPVREDGGNSDVNAAVSAETGEDLWTNTLPVSHGQGVAALNNPVMFSANVLYVVPRGAQCSAANTVEVLQALDAKSGATRSVFTDACRSTRILLPAASGLYWLTPPRSPNEAAKLVVVDPESHAERDACCSRCTPDEQLLSAKVDDSGRLYGVFTGASDDERELAELDGACKPTARWHLTLPSVPAPPNGAGNAKPALREREQPRDNLQTVRGGVVDLLAFGRGWLLFALDGVR